MTKPTVTSLDEITPRVSRLAKRAQEKMAPGLRVKADKPKRYRVRRGALVEDTVYNVECEECGTDDLGDESGHDHVRRTGHTVTLSIDCYRKLEAVK